eukprot:GFKZ01013826.1.p2 GENE.GFKZ01013826.1~~GFKZ01013826.1.p2  ORF type:complete len:162 (+),score=2.38 GFKZ01013826.1:144-629(+)
MQRSIPVLPYHAQQLPAPESNLAPVTPSLSHSPTTTWQGHQVTKPTPSGSPPVTALRMPLVKTTSVSRKADARKPTSKQHPPRPHTYPRGTFPLLLHLCQSHAVHHARNAARLPPANMYVTLHAQYQSPPPPPPVQKPHHPHPQHPCRSTPPAPPAVATTT